MSQSNTTLRFSVPPFNPEAGNRELGAWGEDVACAYLEAKGYEILDRNWRQRAGELDILARAGDASVVAIEVKTRRAGSHVNAEQAMSLTKYKRLRRLFTAWLADQEIRAHRIAIDSIAITVMGDGSIRMRHEEALS